MGQDPLLPSAEDLSGTPVTEIQGSLPDLNDVSLFEITIKELRFFGYNSQCRPFWDPGHRAVSVRLDGTGVYFNDDIDGGNTPSCLPSSDLTNPCETPASGLGPVAPGIYYLGIARSEDGPLDASNNEIFTNLSPTDVVGPNAGVGLAAWDDGAFTQPTDLVNYDIDLAGTTPKPATWALSAGALLAIAMFRRRSSAADAAQKSNAASVDETRAFAGIDAGFIPNLSCVARRLPQWFCGHARPCCACSGKSEDDLCRCEDRPAGSRPSLSPCSPTGSTRRAPGILRAPYIASSS